MTTEREQRLLKRLQKKTYRHAYVSEHVRRGMAHQIKALREDPSRGWNQGELSKRLGKPQSVVSRMEDPSYGKLTVQTLLEVAEAFDVALWVRFVSFPKFLILTEDLSTASMRVESFDDSTFGAPPSVSDNAAVEPAREEKHFMMRTPQTPSFVFGGETAIRASASATTAH